MNRAESSTGKDAFAVRRVWVRPPRHNINRSADCSRSVQNRSRTIQHAYVIHIPRVEGKAHNIAAVLDLNSIKELLHRIGPDEAARGQQISSVARRRRRGYARRESLRLN